MEQIIRPLSNINNSNLCDYTPFSTYSDRTYWNDIDSNIRDLILKDGLNALDRPYPIICASDYMKYIRNGNRVDFENIYFERRYILNSLVMAECMEHQERFIDKIIDGVWLICEESTWVLPAHNSYIRDTPQAILPDTKRPVLDLFSCETAALLSMINYLLGNELDKVSPLIRKRITDELNFRIIDPYINEHFWWMGNEEEPMCNWTSWCTHNILLTAFIADSLSLSQEKKRLIFDKACYSLNAFLKDYGEDGCCDEGAHYFRHAGLCLFSALDILNSVSAGSLESAFQLDKIKNIAAFIYHMNISGPYYFNFADCACKAGYSGAREYLFGMATQQDFLTDYAKKDYITSLNEGLLLADESVKLNLFYRVQQITTSTSILSDNSITTPSISTYSYIWYNSVGIWINKNNTFSLAVKAGDNDDSHNHNDSGSFILYKNGKPVFVDIGVGVYTAKTFSKDRYDIWTMQSSYHNLPTIMGCDEKAGANYHVSDLALQESNEENVISMNLATAYDLDNIDYQRTVSFDKSANEVSLTDKTNASQVVLNFITYFEPEINGSELQIGDCSVIYEGASLLSIEELEINDDRLKQSWDKNLYRIQLKMSDTFKMTIK